MLQKSIPRRNVSCKNATFAWPSRLAPRRAEQASAGLPVDATPERGTSAAVVRVAVRASAVRSPAKAGAPLPRCGAPFAVLAVKYKIPSSVLVVVHTPELQVLLLERADHPGYWQSVTGSQHQGETLEQTAVREVTEETGLEARAYELRDWHMQNQYEIFPEWRWRYAPGVAYNTEHVFGLLLPQPGEIRLAPREHLQFVWLPWKEAAERCFSWSNADAIRRLSEKGLGG